MHTLPASVSTSIIYQPHCTQQTQALCVHVHCPGLVPCEKGGGQRGRGFHITCRQNKLWDSQWVMLSLSWLLHHCGVGLSYTEVDGCEPLLWFILNWRDFMHRICSIHTTTMAALCFNMMSWLCHLFLGMLGSCRNLLLELFYRRGLWQKLSPLDTNCTSANKGCSGEECSLSCPCRSKGLTCLSMLMTLPRAKMCGCF